MSAYQIGHLWFGCIQRKLNPQISCVADLRLRCGAIRLPLSIQSMPTWSADDAIFKDVDPRPASDFLSAILAGFRRKGCPS